MSYTRDKKGWKTKFDAARARGAKLTRDLIDAKTGKKVADAGAKMTPRLAKKLVEKGLTDQFVSSDELVGRYVARDLINEESGEVYVEAGDELTPESIEALEAAGLAELATLAIDHITVGPYIRNTLAARTSATPWRPIRARTATRRWSRSTG